MPHLTRFGRDSFPVVVPETDVHRVLLWANKRNRPELLDQYRLEVDVAPVSITIFECRPPWRPGGDPSWTRFPIARLRYTQSKRIWTLYWRDRNLKFHRYEPSAPTESLDELLDEIDADRTGIFWG